MAGRTDRSQKTARTMSSRQRPAWWAFWPVGAAMLVGALPAAWQAWSPAPPTAITVFIAPGCVCCLRWVTRLRAEGLSVSVQNEASLDSIRARLGVPASKAGCHTAVTREGYVIEGHVPPSDIRRLVATRSALRGLAVPGMPAGSPGMESESPESYDVWALPVEGMPTVYAHHAATDPPTDPHDR